MDDKLLITPAPHISSVKTVRGIMLDVVISLLPATLAGIIIFGIRSLQLVLASVIAAVAAEAIYQKVAKKPVTVNDMSAVVTGLLLALTLPPDAPIWLSLIHI